MRASPSEKQVMELDPDGDRPCHIRRDLNHRATCEFQMQRPLLMCGCPESRVLQAEFVEKVPQLGLTRFVKRITAR